VEATGVSGSFQPTSGGQASFESQVTFTGETSFQEVGSITFRDSGHRLYFSTVGQGYIGPSADPQLKHGSVIWKVERGEGQFAGATGLITSNFCKRHRRSYRPSLRRHFCQIRLKETTMDFGVIFFPILKPVRTSPLLKARGLLMPG
jgi:hypothetical protein